MIARFVTDSLLTSGANSDPAVRRFVNPSRRSGATFPFLVVLQSDWVAETTSVIVAPLVAPDGAKSSARLYPEFEVEGRRLALALTDLASLDRSLLSRRVTNLARDRDRIIVALDFLFTGY